MANVAFVLLAVISVFSVIFFWGRFIPWLGTRSTPPLPSSLMTLLKPEKKELNTLYAITEMLKKDPLSRGFGSNANSLYILVYERTLHLFIMVSRALKNDEIRYGEFLLFSQCLHGVLAYDNCEVLLRKYFKASLAGLSKWIEKSDHKNDDVVIPRIQQLLKQLPPLSDVNEQMLFAVDERRLLRKQQQIEVNVKDASEFYQSICVLAQCVSSVVPKRGVYFRAYQHMVSIDGEYALKLYLHYYSLSHLLVSCKKVSAKMSKVIFKNTQQQQRFNDILLAYKKVGDLEKSLAAVEGLLVVQRKKISINADAVRNAGEKQRNVALILGEYLKDEEEAPPVALLLSDNEAQVALPHADDVPLDPQKALLEYFIASSFRINQQEVNIFAQKHGMFVSQLIDGINETYYDEIDDLLIEEDGQDYLLSETYYTRIFNE